MTSEKEHTISSIDEIVSSQIDNKLVLKKIPKLPRKPEYKGSKFIETDHSNDKKATEHSEENGASSTNKYMDNFVKIIIIAKHLMSLNYQKKVI